MCVFSYLFFSGISYLNEILLEKDNIVSFDNYSKFKNALPLVLVNIVFMTHVYFRIVYLYYTPRSFNLFLAIRDILLTKYVSPILFYITHIIFHSVPILYKFHKVHHEFKEPIGITAAYTHPIDYIFGNLLPLGIIPLSLGIDSFSMTLITVYGRYQSIILEHSNYSNINHHQLHHKYFKYNYGAIWIDNILKTNYKIDNMR